MNDAIQYQIKLNAQQNYMFYGHLFGALQHAFIMKEH